MANSGPPEKIMAADAGDIKGASSNRLITGRDLTKSFRNGGVRIDVLKGINADLDVGETVAIVGASGIGKYCTNAFSQGVYSMHPRGRSLRHESQPSRY